MFLDPQKFAFPAALEAETKTIRNELTQVLAHPYFMAHPLKDVYGEGWDLFALYAFGKKLEKCCALCPATTRLVEAIPDMVGAGFSALRAGATIKWHYDPLPYASHIYRYHLGLIVPPGCEFSVGQETKEWAEGQSLIFQGDQGHRAVNTGEQDRFVLIVDVRRDPKVDFEMPDFEPSDWID